MDKMVKLFGSLLFFLLLITACTVGPDYQRPETPASGMAAFYSVPDDMRQVISREEFSRWWQQINDPWLDNAVDHLLADNLQLKEAAARIQQAWAQLGIARGRLLPALSVSSSALRGFQGIDSGISGFGAPGAGAEQPLDGTGAAGTASFQGNENERIYFTQLEAGLSTSWQVDLFGGLERSSTAARLQYMASLANAEALIHSLISELARRRISLAALQQRLDLARETAENRKLTLNVVERRYRRGVTGTSATDVYLARENLAAVTSRIPDLQSRIRKQLHLLDVLLGRSPGTTSAQKIRLPKLQPPGTVPPGLPAQLIDRRPDLRANEFRLAASVEQVGAAVADLYPDLTLTGAIGLRDDGLSTFFDTANLFGTIVADIMVKLFQGGRLRANIDLQEAEARELAADYAGNVLTALEEVETALSNGRYLGDQLDHLEDRLENTRKAAQQVMEKYSSGLVPLLDVLVAERRRFGAAQEYVLIAQAAWNNRIALYLALGGDWLGKQPELAPARLPQQTKE